MFKAIYGGNVNENLCYPLGRSEGVVGFNLALPRVTLRTLVPYMTSSYPSTHC